MRTLGPPIARTIAGGLLVALLSASPAAGKERLVRAFGIDDGLEASGLSCLVEDREGFLWLCADRGLVRYDGQEFTAWNAEPFGSRPWQLLELPEGGFVFTLQGRHDEGLFTLVDRRLRPWGQGIEPALTYVRDTHLTPDGALWIADGEGLRRRDASGRWELWPRSAFGGLAPYFVRTAFDGPDVLVSTYERTIWRVEARGEATLHHRDEKRIVQIEPTREGRLFLTFADYEFGGGLAELRDGRLEVLHEGEGLGLRELRVVGDSVWVAGDTTLRWHPEEGVESLDWKTDFLLHDDEGSLWLASHRLWQIPEPESYAVGAADGLPDDAPKRLARSGEGVVTAHYSGVGLVTESGARTLHEGFAPRRPCVDGTGTLWFLRRRPGEEGRATRNEEVRWATGAYRGGALRSFPLEPVGWNEQWSCSEDGRGGVYIAHRGTLFHTRGGDAEPRSLGSLPTAERGTADVLRSSSGELWVASSRVACRARDGDVLARRASWECLPVDDLHWVHDLFEAPSGDVWLATGEGVRRFDGRAWSPLAGLEPAQVFFLSPASSGGVWIPGPSGTVRVVEVPSDPGRVEVVERLSRGLGLSRLAFSEVLEEPDGSLWLASGGGLQHVPGHLRGREAPRPRVVLVEAPEERVRPFSRNSVELRFAALSFRDSRALRYRVRARPTDPWSETRVPEFRFTSLRPGRYEAQVVASVDGLRWSERPALFAFEIRPPWYATWWARLGALGALALAFYALYRVRVAVLLRLERQRTRIAMDLHDEMGSGLGGIGILAELLGGERIDDASRTKLAGQIATSARELSASLADIVWALRPRAHSLGAVLARLEVRANELFPRGDVDLEAEGALGVVALSPAVTKNVLSIGSEALHNAVRHGRPEHLVLSVGPEGGGRWRLCVRDDGRGFDPEGRAREGLGLTSMERRAADIRGRLRIASRPGEGCLVCVAFDPHDQGGAARR